LITALIYMRTTLRMKGGAGDDTEI
jgi:hypothetical protein